jgi:hypothetical protein
MTATAKRHSAFLCLALCIDKQTRGRLAIRCKLTVTQAYFAQKANGHPIVGDVIVLSQAASPILASVTGPIAPIK